MHIAIIRLSALGDVVNSLVVVQFIKQNFPECKIDWICEKAFYGILEHNPELHAIHTVNLKEIKKKKNFTLVKALITKLRSLPKYDLIIDMQGLIKSSLVSRFIKGPVAGYDKTSAREGLASFFYTKKVNLPYDINSIERNTKLIEKVLDIKISHTAITQKKPFLYFKQGPFTFTSLLQKEKKNILLVVGSSWPSKNYPKERFTELASLLDENILICWGNAEEEACADFISQACKHAHKLPKLSLNELKALISKVDLVIGNDTGPTHMAWAMNQRTICLFGCTPRERMFETAQNISIKSSSPINHFKLNKQDFSIQEIEPNLIATKAKELLCASK